MAGKILPTWSDPRLVYKGFDDPKLDTWQTNPYADIQETLKAVRDSQRQIVEEMNNLKGFYIWLMHAYPDTLIQYKAIQQLQAAANEQARGESP